MNTYVTGATIKKLREARQITRAELAECLGVSSKTISKWETGKGLPDISLLQPPAQTLGISVIDHPMTKQHFVSFVAHVTSDRLQMVKLYPEGDAQTRLQIRGRGYLYYYCNQHGLFRKKA